MNADERVAGNSQSLRLAARGDQEPLIVDLLMRRCRHDLFDRINRDHLSVQPKLNRLLAIEALGMDENLRFITCAKQKLLGKRRPVIGRQALGRQNQNRTGLPLEPQCFCCDGAGDTASDEEMINFP